MAAKQLAQGVRPTLRRLTPTLALLLAAAPTAGGGCGDLDQFQPLSDGAEGLVASYIPDRISQTFRVGKTGLLRAVEVAPQLQPFSSDSILTAILYDSNDTEVASGNVSSLDFDIQFPPAPLFAGIDGPGFIDVSASNALVTEGDLMRLELGLGGQCDPIGCFIGIGIASEALVDRYPDGTATHNTIPLRADLAFKTLVDETP